MKTLGLCMLFRVSLMVACFCAFYEPVVDFGMVLVSSDLVAHFWPFFFLLEVVTSVFCYPYFL